MKTNIILGIIIVVLFILEEKRIAKCENSFKFTFSKYAKYNLCRPYFAPYVKKDDYLGLLKSIIYNNSEKGYAAEYYKNKGNYSRLEYLSCLVVIDYFIDNSHEIYHYDDLILAYFTLLTLNSNYFSVFHEDVSDAMNHAAFILCKYDKVNIIDRDKNYIINGYNFYRNSLNDKYNNKIQGE